MLNREIRLFRQIGGGNPPQFVNLGRERCIPISAVDHAPGTRRPLNSGLATGDRREFSLGGRPSLTIFAQTLARRTKAIENRSHCDVLHRCRKRNRRTFESSVSGSLSRF